MTTYYHEMRKESVVISYIFLEQLLEMTTFHHENKERKKERKNLDPALILQSIVTSLTSSPIFPTLSVFSPLLCVSAIFPSLPPSLSLLASLLSLSSSFFQPPTPSLLVFFSFPSLHWLGQDWNPYFEFGPTSAILLPLSCSITVTI